MTRVTSITSREKELLVRLRRLASQPDAYRKLGKVWIEGEHLCAAYLERASGEGVQAGVGEVPGALVGVATCLAEANANIAEVHHQRAFTNAPIRAAEVDFVLATRGHEHVQQVIHALARAGFEARLHNE